MMHGWHGYGMGFGLGFGRGFGSIFMVVFGLIIIYLVVGWLKRERHCEPNSPEEILKKRYASGEISKEEFAEMQRTLRS